MERIEDPLFESFWNEFRAAVSQGSKENVAKLTHFPLPRWRRCLEKEEFIKRFSEVFFPEVTKAISASPHLVQSNNHPGDYYAFIVHYRDANEGMEEFFEFSKVNEVFKLTRIGHLDTACKPANKSLKPTNPAKGDR
jgi:hypothetical protein